MPPGPLPKNPAQRRRRNKASTAKTLVAITPGQTVIPELPARHNIDFETGEIEEWHPAAEEFWTSLRESPMAAEYDRSDLSGLLIIADLTHDYWAGKRGMTKKEIAAEIRLQRREYGLGPMSRRSLQWQIEQAEKAVDQGERRRAANHTGGADDPRLRDVIDEEEDSA
jgi:hypothetical protein